jgi:hypothetical protein
MRIVLAGPPKTGNVWVENILALMYDLEVLQVVPKDSTAFTAFCRDGQFADGAIFHQHFSPDDEFLAATSEAGVDIVTVIRNPYDTFVSVYYYIQNFSQAFVEAADPAARLAGKAIDSPEAFEFLAEGFKVNLQQAVDWLRSGRSNVVRYEDIQVTPVRTISRLAATLKAVPEERIRQAIILSRAHLMRSRDEVMAKHIRSGTVGDWMNHLTEQHLDVFREHHSESIRLLDYDVL